MYYTNSMKRAIQYFNLESGLFTRGVRTQCALEGCRKKAGKKQKNRTLCRGCRLLQAHKSTSYDPTYTHYRLLYIYL